MSAICPAAMSDWGSVKATFITVGMVPPASIA